MKSAAEMVFLIAFMIHLGNGAHGAPPVDSLRAALREQAADIAKIIAKHNGGSVAIGAFVGSVEVAGSAGPEIQRIFHEELRKANVVIDIEKHRFEISGRYQPIKDTQIDLQVIKLSVWLTEKDTGEMLAERPTRFVLPKDANVAAMQGAIISGPPLVSPYKMSAAIEIAKTEPQFKIQDSGLWGKTGNYAVQVIVKENGRYVPRPVTVMADGPLNKRPAVALKAGDIYGVRLINKSNIEAAVELRIDGVNCFAFGDSGAAYWIVEPGKHLDILGWHKDDKESIEFKVVTEFPDTAAAKLKLIPSDTVGLITAAFSAAWKTDDPPPDDEATLSRGTGFGDEIPFKVKVEGRNIGKMRDLLSLRYEKVKAKRD